MRTICGITFVDFDDGDNDGANDNEDEEEEDEDDDAIMTSSSAMPPRSIALLVGNIAHDKRWMDVMI